MDFARLGRDGNADNRRVAGRVILQGIECSIGQVLDLSATGMRVECASKPTIKEGQTFGMVLQGLHGPVNMVGQVAWIKKSGWRAHQIGIRFLDPSPELRRTISELARGVSTNATIVPGMWHGRHAG
jgi:hypothetical protein